jgi:protocatechuate 3,4-dioxygenase beta subunit
MTISQLTNSTAELQAVHAHGGLAQDLPKLLAVRGQRRDALRWIGASVAVALPQLGCGGGSSGAVAVTPTTSASGPVPPASSPVVAAPPAGTASATTATGSANCKAIPAETAGPFPGDGTNGPNALALTGIVRSNIKTSLTTSTVAAGVPLTITLKLVNSATDCSPLAGYAVYLWHCDQSGGYSLYSAGITQENYLRGVQVSDATGTVTFQTIFPGCYAGRYPHVHFEVFRSLAAATSGSNGARTSQLTFTAGVFTDVYNQTGYSASARNLAAITLATDNVFSDDGGVLQIATTTGSVATGYQAVLQAPIL